jgi:ketosteroid isomerase-like protein
MSAEADVRRASTSFYSALNTVLNGDAQPLEDIWSHGSDVTTFHPIGGRQVGWTAVHQVWQEVTKVFSDGQVSLTDQLICGGGELAIEVGTERGHAKLNGQDLSIEHRVTNVYRLESGAWKIIHHHTDVSPAALAIMAG